MGDTNDKIAVFVNAGYFQMVLKEYGLGENQVDFGLLAQELCARAGGELLRAYFYDCLPPEPDKMFPSSVDIDAYRIKERFFESLRNAGFEVRLGRLAENPRGNGFVQKMVDVQMAVDLVSLCADKEIGRAILITGDSDLIPAIQEARKRSVEVTVYYHIFSSLIRIRNDFFNACDKCFLIRRELIEMISLKNDKRMPVNGVPDRMAVKMPH